MMKRGADGDAERIAAGTQEEFLNSQHRTVTNWRDEYFGQRRRKR